MKSRLYPVLICLVSVFSSARPSWAAVPMMDSQMLPATRQAIINFMWIGRFTDATQQAVKALRLAQQQYGELHPLIVPILNDLGTLYRCQALYSKAQECYDWGLAIREKTLGSEDPSVAESLELSGGLNIDLGRYSLALIQFQRALKIQEKYSKKDPTLVAAILQQMGLVCLLMKDGQKASEHLDRCLQIRESAWGKDNSLLVDTLNLRAQADQLLGKNDLAQKELERALGIQRRNFPPERLEVLDAMEHLGSFYISHGRTDEGKDLYTQSEKIRDRFLSTDSFTNIPVLEAAARADMVLGRLKESGILLARVMKLRIAFYGSDHPLIAFCHEDWASLAEKEGNKAQAIDHLREAKKILERYFKADHPEIQAVEKGLKELSQ